MLLPAYAAAIAIATAGDGAMLLDGEVLVLLPAYAAATAIAYAGEGARLLDADVTVLAVLGRWAALDARWCSTWRAAPRSCLSHGMSTVGELLPTVYRMRDTQRTV